MRKTQLKLWITQVNVLITDFLLSQITLEQYLKVLLYVIMKLATILI